MIPPAKRARDNSHRKVRWVTIAGSTECPNVDDYLPRKSFAETQLRVSSSRRLRYDHRMNRDTKYPLLVKPLDDRADGVYQHLTREEAGWEFLNFGARLMRAGTAWEGHTGEHEYGIILLSGNYQVETSAGSWRTVNGRKDVFSGIAHTLYLPRQTAFRLTSESELLDIAYGWCDADEDHPVRFKTPDEVSIEIRGGDNATRQINSLIEPGFDCQRLVSVEVYTPSGNWSSFPAHKHDERRLNEDGSVREARLEETYFYKIEKPQGYAIQQVYTSERDLDEMAYARTNDVVMVPRG